MLTATLPFVSLLAALACTEPALLQKGKVQPPPGMVLVEGGTTKIGSSVKYVEDIGKTNETLFGNLARETPQHDVRIDDFFLMVSEVTNEQFAAFVRATGARPPEHWAEKVIDDASGEFLRKQGEEAAKAKAEGRPVPAKEKFVRSEWWRKNWEGKPWEIPKGKETLPVVYVDYADVLAYCRWSGLRPMSEFEYQRAGRGRGDALYPWGNDTAVTTNAVTQEIKLNGKEVRPAEPFKVASQPGGKTAEGIYDLCGNVWEWTSSTFSPFPGYKDLKLTVGNGKQARDILGLTRWDANQRVVVGGCFQQSILVARVTTRRGTERIESTDSLGFRCASSAVPGLDLSSAILRDDFPIERRPAGAQFDGSKAFAIDRWMSEPGSATTVVAEGQPATALPGYSIITGYDYITFVPAVEIEATAVSALDDMSHAKGPVPVGILSTTRDLVEPALKKGTYCVSYRGKGPLPKPDEKPKDEKPKEEKKASQEPGKPEEPAVRKMAEFKVPEGFDPTKDTLIFYTADGSPAGWIEAPNFDYARPLAPKATVAAAKRPVVVDAGGLKKRTEEDGTLVTLSLNCWVRVSNKGFTFNLPLWFKPGEVGAGWRLQ
jgi:sulfatase modifying factor 1